MSASDHGGGAMMPTFQPGPLVELLEILGDDGPAVVSDIVATYLDDLPGLLGSIHATDGSGSSRDTASVRSAAHTLKSASASVGAERLSALCRDVENAAREDDVATLDGLLPLPDHVISETTMLLGEWLAEVAGTPAVG